MSASLWNFNIWRFSGLQHSQLLFDMCYKNVSVNVKLRKHEFEHFSLVLPNFLFLHSCNRRIKAYQVNKHKVCIYDFESCYSKQGVTLQTGNILKLHSHWSQKIHNSHGKQKNLRKKILVCKSKLSKGKSKQRHK